VTFDHVINPFSMFIKNFDYKTAMLPQAKGAARNRNRSIYAAKMSPLVKLTQILKLLSFFKFKITGTVVLRLFTGQEISCK
jgi:hypothetical protein